MPHLAHQPDPCSFLREPSPDDPWRVLISGCLAGLPVGVDGTSYGMSLDGLPWLRGPAVALFPFCPEDHGLGTPRGMPDLHGGDGFDVLDGQASVQDEDGHDMTAGMLRGAEAMLAFAQAHAVDFALLTDRSGACGSQCISVGCRFIQPVRHRLGVGVAAATLLRGGTWLVSQRDHRTLESLRERAEPGYRSSQEVRDHHRHPWVEEHLPEPAALTVLRPILRSGRHPHAAVGRLLEQLDPDGVRRALRDPVGHPALRSQLQEWLSQRA